MPDLSRTVDIHARVINATFSLSAPLNHGAFGEAAGNAVLFRRVQLATTGAQIPAISGNAVRGVLRRIVMRDLFQLCDLSRETMTGNPKLWDKLYAALANGGHLTGSENRVDPERIARIRQALPPVSLFGAALYTWMLNGHFSSGWLWPRCEETVDAGLCSCGKDRKAEDLIEEVSFTRHVEREYQDTKETGVTPMPVTVEALSTGTVLEGRFTFLGTATEIEQSCLAWGITKISQLGGKGAGGLGRVVVEHDGDPSLYEAWRHEPKDEARETLLGLVEA